MKTPQDGDPRRWKDAPATVTGPEAELAAVARLLHDAPPPDEVRLAQLTREVARRYRGQTKGDGSQGTALLGGLRFWRWSRTTFLVLLSLLVGGMAAAITGNIIQRLNKGNSKAARSNLGSSRGRGNRRWRVEVARPTQLDLSVGPAGPELSVVSGQAAVTGSDLPGVLQLDPGASWQAPGAREAAATGSTAAPLTGAAVAASSPSEVTGASAVPAGQAAPLPVPERRERAGVNRSPRHMAVASPEARGVRNISPAPDADATPSAASQAATQAVTSGGEQPASTPASIVPTQPPPLVAATRAASSPSTAWVAPAVHMRPSTSQPRLVTSEAALLARALERLRRDHDPLWALEDLDQHARNYPTGNLRQEAALARAEALLALDRSVEALTVLDPVALEPTAANRRVRLASGELRAQEGQQAQAIAEFDRVLTDGPADDLSARALYGRAIIRLRGAIWARPESTYAPIWSSFPQVAIAPTWKNCCAAWAVETFSRRHTPGK